MKDSNILSASYIDRLSEILDISWRILKSRFIDGRHEVTKEAPFQHYFAHIIATVGEAFCTKRDDIFLVDLETRLPNVKGKTKYLDITCAFPTQQCACAVELKFKTAQQGAQDHGRIDAFVDIEALEIACGRGYDFGRFYMITNSTPYINKSQRGVGTVFITYDGAVTEQNQTFHCPQSKGRENVKVELRNSYQFEWEKAGDWYFLKLNIRQTSQQSH